MSFKKDTLFAFPLQLHTVGLAFAANVENVQMLPGEFIAIEGYWYTVSADSGAFSLVGKTAFSHDEWLKGPSSEELRGDVESLLGASIDTRLCAIDATMHVIRVMPFRAGFWRPDGEIQEGEYISTTGSLYLVRHNKTLKWLSRYTLASGDHTTDFEEFADTFTKITGKTVMDGETLINDKTHVVKTEDDIDKFFRRLTPKQQEEFLVHAAHLMGVTKVND